MTLEDAVVCNEQSFWNSLNRHFGSVSHLPVIIDGPDSFREAFEPTHKRWSRPLVIFIDEFDKLHSEDAADACSAILSSIRGIRNDKGKTVIHSIVSVGTFAILELNQTKPFLSPFNATENFRGVSLTVEQVQGLYKEYSMENNITIEPKIVEEIYELTGGYVKYVRLLCKVQIFKMTYL